jgi:hypothetical protein
MHVNRGVKLFATTYISWRLENFSNSKYTVEAQVQLSYLFLTQLSLEAVDWGNPQLAPPLHEQILPRFSMDGRKAVCDRSAMTKLRETLNEAIPPSLSGILVARKIAKVDDHTSFPHPRWPHRLGLNRDTTYLLRWLSNYWFPCQISFKYVEIDC